MAEGVGSTLVHVLVVALCLTAFGFAIAAERRRSTVSFFFIFVVMCLQIIELFFFYSAALCGNGDDLGVWLKLGFLGVE